MKVLVIGGGGREHALVWSLGRSSQVSEVVCAPGNGGIAKIARCVPVDVNDLAAMVALVEAERPALTVVGPEVPLSLGIVDELERRGCRVFGPTKAAARLESSKAFAKEFMQRHDIPTAAHAVCTTLDEVREQLRRFSVPVVVKADGLAAGKGVVICETHLQAETAAAEMFSGALLGTREAEVVLEEFLTGEELSFFALCDGVHAVEIASAQDHKRVGEGDTGPNTGGMGAYSTDGLATPAMRHWLLRNVAQKVVDGMKAEGDAVQGHPVLRLDDDAARADGAGVQYALWRSGDGGDSAADGERCGGFAERFDRRHGQRDCRQDEAGCERVRDCGERRVSGEVCVGEGD